MSASKHPHIHARVLTHLAETIRSYRRVNPSAEVFTLSMGKEMMQSFEQAIEHFTNPTIEGYSIVATELKQADVELLAKALGMKLVPIKPDCLGCAEAICDECGPKR